MRSQATHKSQVRYKIPAKSRRNFGLKGLRDPIRLVEVGWRGPEVDRETDPMCGLLLHADDVVTRTTWRGTTYAFCCDLCQEAFMENPDRFVAASDG